ncbi:hypothetical protein RHSIM_Rhsim01G0265400 [Rhododendron simsii]|uniref:Uncharacterized protein n=1 Tax=Rhododendron simsii TaxID=118357 RepID=A0A834LZ76_RHOSS|nr:hypothetical protein RHSIM_Rhsim01G0265400 [Rhododendron simsii]
MAKLISSRCSIQSVVPESYILPPEQRPGYSVAPPCKTIPIIDLHGDRIEVIQEIIEASQEYGFFQITETMAKLISSRSSIQPVVQESYILPPEQRPGNSVAPPCKTIPVIDLHGDRSDVIQEIIKASHEYGFFQPTDPVDHITGKERVTLEVNDKRGPLIATMRLVPLLVDSAMNTNEDLVIHAF